ncbi:MAG: sugar phosphate isomerase/epimerase family protein, partial [Limisphaerales bacterium]
MPDSHQFSIPIGWDDHAKKLAFAEQHGLGVEVAAFATGPALHDASARTQMERGLGIALRDFPNARSFHGAFIDLNLHSEDPAIAAIARQRIGRDVETASRLGCRIVVFHTGFNPLVPVRRYEEEFLDRHAAFWPAMADQWPDITICLENMWESSPQLWERLLRGIAHPQVRMCLDVAHAHAYGDFAVETWMDRLKGRIAHMHWNDNHGDTDSHLALGEGNVPWKNILAATRALPGRVSVLLELNSLPGIRQSLRFLTEL